MAYIPYFDFNNFFYLAQQVGFFTMLLPFLLIFSIVYAILVRIDVFRKTPAAGVVVALAIAFFALTNYQISYIMAKLFSNLAIALIVLLSVVILFGLLNKDITQKAGVFFVFVVILIAIILLFKTFEFRLIWLYQYFNFLGPLIIIIIAIALILVFSREQPPEKSFSKAVEEALFGEGKE
ncbi:MAG: hypothetical protein QW622_00410 [Candidatus Pacearchaeota archaeon]